MTQHTIMIIGGQVAIDIRYNQLSHGGNHAYLVLTDTETGERWAFRGGPEGNGLGWFSSGTPFGDITSNFRPYNERHRDWSTNPSACQRLLDNDDPIGPYREALENLSERINGEDLSYHTLGPNSNTVAFEGLMALDLPAPPPPVFAPGWNDSLWYNWR